MEVGRWDKLSCLQISAGGRRLMLVYLVRSILEGSDLTFQISNLLVQLLASVYIELRFELGNPSIQNIVDS